MWLESPYSCASNDVWFNLIPLIVWLLGGENQKTFTLTLIHFLNISRFHVVPYTTHGGILQNTIHGDIIQNAIHDDIVQNTIHGNIIKSTIHGDIIPNTIHDEH